MKKALQALLAKHFGSSKTQQPTKEVLDIVIDSSNGDIRSAINALQFSCIVPKGAKKKRVQANVVMESVTRREQSLALFHLIGKVLYNKRSLPSSIHCTSLTMLREGRCPVALCRAQGHTTGEGPGCGPQGPAATS